jgi:hypothetical protein
LCKYSGGMDVGEEEGFKVTRYRREERMNNVTLIRVVAGILAAVVVVILVFRSKKIADLRCAN